MNFDYILMNPPYDGSLHLKIVEKAIELLKDDNSICVNLSPSRALQDPLAKYKQGSDYKKFEETVFKHMKSIDIVRAMDAVKMFGAEMIMDLGIYVFTKGSYETYKEVNINSIIDKVVSTGLSTLCDKVEENKSNGWRVRVSEMRPIPTNRQNYSINASGKTMLFETTHNTLSWVYNNGFMNDGRHWSKNKLNGAGGPKSYTENDPLPMSISFSNETEAENFEKSTKTTFHRYLVLTMKTDQHFPMKYIPWLGDVEDGYKTEWTNEDLCKVFGITGYKSDDEGEPGSEWETILETMKPYLGVK